MAVFLDSEQRLTYAVAIATVAVGALTTRFDALTTTRFDALTTRTFDVVVAAGAGAAAVVAVDVVVATVALTVIDLLTKTFENDLGYGYVATLIIRVVILRT